MHYFAVVLLSWICGLPLFLDKVVPPPTPKPDATATTSDKTAQPPKEEKKKPEDTPRAKPASTPALSQTTAPKPQAPASVKEHAPSRTTVYVTKSGNQYHSAGCFYLRDTSIPIDLNDTGSKYEPCGHCHPAAPAVTKVAEAPTTIDSPAPQVVPAPQREKTVRVKGYYRKDGTYVQPHSRRPSRKK